ncbi:MAG: peptidoglycan-associated lipoprotein Pal [candidate division NC10 bacterium]|nr:peptidoglycan-associated lipoprotein Pal [candidate division NC10 bacterium]
MKADLAEAKAAGAETFAPEEYAHAEACLDILTHEATEFHPFADPNARNYIGKCRAAFAALKSSVAASRRAKVPIEAVSPPAAPKPEAARVGEAEKAKESPLKDVFFDFDKSVIRADAKQSLDENVRWLKANTHATIVIEGHCDERGTQEYNLALGQRRAKSVQDHLVAAGVSAKRTRIISYGKERPFALGHDESAWKWNRRAHFVIQ